MTGAGDAHPPLFRPFAGLRAAPKTAADVAAPPYDVLTTEEARALAEAGRLSFVHVSRPEVDLPAGADPHGADAYAKAAETLARMREDGVLRQDEAPCFYVYRLDADGHAQTGVMGAASIAAYAQGRIRRHELTRPDKEDDRVRHMEALGAQTGPVMLTHRRRAALADKTAALAAGAPDVSFAAADGVTHTLWVVEDADAVASLTDLVEAVDALYIADGHHRTAAAGRVATARRAADRDAGPDAPWNGFLAVLFPEDEVRILDYNRVVRDLGGMSADAFLGEIGKAFGIEDSDIPVRPETRGQFGLYMDGRWRRLRLLDPPADEAPALDRLDITLLTERLLAPVLGIGDPRSDPRIDFVGGGRGLQELSRQVDSGAMAAAFALYPTALSDLMAVADAGAVMPPKSTWFEPKLADGLVSLLLD